MSLAGRRVSVLSLVAALMLAGAVPAAAVLPPPFRLALMFDLEPWSQGRDRSGPYPPGHVVIEWSRDGSS